MSISTDFSLPTFYERDKSVTVSMPVFEFGAVPVTPTAGTFTLYDGSKVVVTTGAVTFVAGVATYRVLAAVLPVSVGLSDDWQEEWALTVGGDVETIRRDAYLCLRSFYNVVNEMMLLRRVSDLNNLRPSSMSSFQGYINEAFAAVQTRLLQSGKRPFLVMNAWALKGVTLATTLQYIFSDLDTYMGDGRYAAKTKEYAEEADKEFNSLKLEYDYSQTNQRANADDSAPATPVIYLNTPPRGFWRGPSSY
jgi:hypothetical protein